MCVCVCVCVFQVNCVLCRVVRRVAVTEQESQHERAHHVSQQQQQQQHTHTHTHTLNPTGSVAGVKGSIWNLKTQAPHVSGIQERSAESVHYAALTLLTLNHHLFESSIYNSITTYGLCILCVYTLHNHLTIIACEYQRHSNEQHVL